MNTLLDRIADLYAADPVACDGMLAAAARELRALRLRPPISETSLRLSVCRHMPATFDGAERGPLAAVAARFAEYEPHAMWRQNPNYTPANIGQKFLDNYGYVELVGRDRPWQNDRFAIGFLLLGPGAHYPAHSHPASEVYHVVSGIAEWRKGDEAWAPQPLGAAIYHAPGVVHETRVVSAPLLALYCWAGDIAIAAKLA
ncbi:MAG: dimethylsulfonioproprionate lyase family protein [Hyphomicrobiaceae bacterium]